MQFLNQKKMFIEGDIMEISILVGQFPITLDIESNLNNIETILANSEKDDLVVYPYKID